MHRISAYILAFNEAEKIADAVSSVLWADEIVVADSASADDTVLLSGPSTFVAEVITS